MNNFYNKEELDELGFKSLGSNVLISKKASIYNPEEITIGSNVRIDDFCILSGKIKIGNYVHISAYTTLYGRYGIDIGNFCGCSPRCTLFSATDDFSGEFMVGPLVPEKYTNVTNGKVILKDFVQIGCNSIVMPNIIVNEGSAVGALSFVNKNLDSWGIYAGIPAKKKKERSKNILNIVKSIF